MSGWLERLTKFHHYHYPVVAVGLFVATVVFGEPGVHELVLGPIRIDAFWVAIGSSMVLFLLGVTDEYEPADYGLDTEEYRYQYAVSSGTLLVPATTPATTATTTSASTAAVGAIVAESGSRRRNVPSPPSASAETTPVASSPAARESSIQGCRRAVA